MKQNNVQLARTSLLTGLVLVCTASCSSSGLTSAGGGGTSAIALGGQSAQSSGSTAPASGGTSTVGGASASGGSQSRDSGVGGTSPSSSSGGKSSSVPAGGAESGGSSTKSSPSGQGGASKGGTTGTGGSVSGPTSAKAGGGGVVATGGSAGKSSIASAGAGTSAGGTSSSGGASSDLCVWDKGPSAKDGALTCYWFSQGTSKDEKTCPGGYKTYCGYCGSETGTKPQGSGQIWCPINDIKSSVQNISTEHFVAIHPGPLAQGKNCGACIEVTYMGRSIVATVVDACPSCVSEQAIDLSLSAAKALGMDEEMGQVESGNGVRWRIVGCPTTGNISVGFNGGYQGQVYFQNTPFPIASASSDGKEASANTGFWDFGKVMGGQQVTLTDVMGNTITGTVPTSPGTLGTQFEAKCKQ